MRSIICFITFSFFPVIIFGQVRGTTWGQSTTEVKNTIEEEILYDEDGSLGVEANLAGLDAFIFYQFIQDQLVDIRISFQENYTNENQFIEDYNKVGEILTEKYGTPTVDESVWRDDLYKDDPSEYGFAVSLGDYILGRSFDSESTEIEHQLFGSNYEITHLLIYYGKEYKELSEEQKKQDQLDDF
jgi:hypothetical protein